MYNNYIIKQLHMIYHALKHSGRDNFGLNGFKNIYEQSK